MLYFKCIVNVCFPHCQKKKKSKKEDMPNQMYKYVRTPLIKQRIHHFLFNIFMSIVLYPATALRNKIVMRGQDCSHISIFIAISANLCKGLRTYLDNSLYLFWKM